MGALVERGLLNQQNLPATAGHGHTYHYTLPPAVRQALQREAVTA